MTKRWLPFLLIFGVVLVLLFGSAMVMQYRCPTRYGYGGMMGPWMMGGFGFGGMLLGVFFLVVLVGGAVWLIQSLSRGAAGPSLPPGETALEILQRRYASGEITKQQYAAMKRDLGL